MNKRAKEPKTIEKKLRKKLRKYKFYFIKIEKTKPNKESLLVTRYRIETNAYTEKRNIKKVLLIHTFRF
jgi:hypothetical protein